MFLLRHLLEAIRLIQLCIHVILAVVKYLKSLLCITLLPTSFSHILLILEFIIICIFTWLICLRFRIFNLLRILLIGLFGLLLIGLVAVGNDVLEGVVVVVGANLEVQHGLGLPELLLLLFLLEAVTS